MEFGNPNFFRKCLAHRKIFGRIVIVVDRVTTLAIIIKVNSLLSVNSPLCTPFKSAKVHT